jgi:hypothetical protein
MARNWKRFTTIAVAMVLLASATVGLAALTARISLGFTTTYTSTGDLSTPTDAMNIARTIEFTSGTGANQANVIFADSRGLVDNADNDANEVLNLKDSGTLLDPLGTALTLTKLKAIYIYNTSTTASLKVGGGTTPVGFMADASDILTIPAGGKLVLTAPDATGWDVTTNKNILVMQGGALTGTLTYEIICLGVD